MTHQLILEIIVKFISVGNAIVKESFMNTYRKIIFLITLTVMIILLTNCTRIKFDGFDPSTALVRWVITHDR